MENLTFNYGATPAAVISDHQAQLESSIDDGVQWGAYNERWILTPPDALLTLLDALLLASREDQTQTSRMSAPGQLRMDILASLGIEER